MKFFYFYIENTIYRSSHFNITSFLYYKILIFISKYSKLLCSDNNNIYVIFKRNYKNGLNIFKKTFTSYIEFYENQKFCIKAFYFHPQQNLFNSLRDGFKQHLFKLNIESFKNMFSLKIKFYM